MRRGFGETWYQARQRQRRESWERLLPRLREPLPADLCELADAWPTLTDRVRYKLGRGDTRKFPADMQGRFNIDGHIVVVRPGSPAHRTSYGLVGSSKHRVFFEVNGRLIPTGRVHQALCGKHRGRAVRGPRGRYMSPRDVR